MAGIAPENLSLPKTRVLGVRRSRALAYVLRTPNFTFFGGLRAEETAQPHSGRVKDQAPHKRTDDKKQNIEDPNDAIHALLPSLSKFRKTALRQSFIFQDPRRIYRFDHRHLHSAG